MTDKSSQFALLLSSTNSRGLLITVSGILPGNDQIKREIHTSGRPRQEQGTVILIPVLDGHSPFFWETKIHFWNQIHLSSIFYKIIRRTLVLLWSHWCPCFGLSDVSSGFQSQGGIPWMLCHLHAMDSPDSPLVRHLLTSRRPSRFYPRTSTYTSIGGATG